MGVADDIKKNAKETFGSTWTVRNGTVVPSATDLNLTNDAVRFATATVLYADLDQSTALVEDHRWDFAGEVYKTFLYAASRLIRNRGGSIVHMTATALWASSSAILSASMRSSARLRLIML